MDDAEDAGLGDSSGADAAAPVPPHERQWRHPSEIGFATMASIDAAPINIGRTGRGLVGFISITGVALSVVLVLSLQPTSHRSSHRDVVALTNSHLRVASFDYPKDRITEPPATTTRPTSPVSTVAVSIPPLFRYPFGITNFDPGSVRADATPPAGPTTTSADSPNERVSAPQLRAMGVLSESGDHLLTTLAAVGGIESIDVRLPDGRTVRARILHTLPDLHIAVLSISDDATTGARADIKASGLGISGSDYALGQPVLVLQETPVEMVIGEPLDDVVVSLITFTATAVDPNFIAEGTPVVSKSGHLLGLCTHWAGQLGFVPVSLFEAALTQMLGSDAESSTRSTP